MTFDPRVEYRDSDIANSYDQKFKTLSGRIFHWAESRQLERIIHGILKGGRVLDAPCGTGRLTEVFLTHGLAILGGDISGEMIGIARHRHQSVNGELIFSQMDFLHVPLADGAVTATFSIRFLVHIPPHERVAILKEFRRVSRQWVVISLSISTPWHRLRRRIKGWLGHDKPIRHPITDEDMRRELAQAGLKEVKRFYTFPIVSEEILVVCEPS